MTQTPGDAVVRLDSVSRLYRRGPQQIAALAEVSFRVAAAESLAIMGPSGAGKTTLLNVLAGLDRPTSGDVWIGGRQIGALGQDAATVFRRRNIGFVFQFFNLLPLMTARANIALPLLADGAEQREVARRADEMLEAVGLADRAAHRPSELSGGEQQRVAVARALVMRPRLLLADEPTGNLDAETGEMILALLAEARSRTGVAVILVTHSQAAAATCDRLLRMRDGRITGPEFSDGANGAPASVARSS